MNEVIGIGVTQAEAVGILLIPGTATGQTRAADRIFAGRAVIVPLAEETLAQRSSFGWSLVQKSWYVRARYIIIGTVPQVEVEADSETCGESSRISMRIESKRIQMQPSAGYGRTGTDR